MVALDVYIDGKLVRTCVLPGVAKPDNNANIVVLGGAKFSGYAANFQYWNEASNPQQHNIYKSGLIGSWLSNLFNKYRIKVSFINNKEKPVSKYKHFSYSFLYNLSFSSI